MTRPTGWQSPGSTLKAASVGPGREHYLDRLVAAEIGGDVKSIEFDAYYSALSQHYRDLASLPARALARTSITR